MSEEQKRDVLKPTDRVSFERAGSQYNEVRLLFGQRFERENVEQQYDVDCI